MITAFAPGSIHASRIDKPLTRAYVKPVVSHIVKSNLWLYFEEGIMEKQYRILLLEDEPLLRRVLTLSLAGQGYQVIAAGSPEDCETMLRALGWGWPDLVLSDANLCRNPDILLGYLFHTWWRTRFPVPPFLFMRGHARFVRLPDEGGCRVGHILKPFAPSDLLLLIRAMMAE